MVTRASFELDRYRARLWQQSAPTYFIMMMSSTTFFQVLAWIILAIAGMSFASHALSILKADQARRQAELAIAVPVFAGYLSVWSAVALRNQHIAWIHGTNLISVFCFATAAILLFYADSKVSKFNRRDDVANHLVQGV